MAPTPLPPNLCLGRTDLRAELQHIPLFTPRRTIPQEPAKLLYAANTLLFPKAGLLAIWTKGLRV
ncbi:hypothetical protein M407DRAFT_31551 [Tulasnella calospora MUT 4182]|uniref:Uncharacterized protein n=1 Tax=Tulasnella calospora MUT 4182 TaxID=1051891 RepID=A0A0C3KBG0_9AGAM|nr:hypothetical protein M407DRAFT_31551 [Tulasnella calospora MUT 4182]